MKRATMMNRVIVPSFLNSPHYIRKNDAYETSVSLYFYLLDCDNKRGSARMARISCREESKKQDTLLHTKTPTKKTIKIDENSAYW
jgi:hypothetical protein